MISSYGANVNTRNAFATPLILAINHQHETITKLLLGHKADIDCTIFNKTPFIFDNTPLTQAISVGNMDIVKILLENGANPNKVYGNSPLSAAIEKQNIECIHLLLKCRARIQHYDLTKAILFNNIEILELLLDKGAPIKGKHCDSDALIDVSLSMMTY